MSSRSGRRPGDIDEKELEIIEWPIPQVGISPITGIEGTSNWGAINRPDTYSRAVIGDSDLDDSTNFLPMLVHHKMVPNFGSNLGPLPSAINFMWTAVIGGNPYIFSLCANSHIYQSTYVGGVQDLGLFSQSCDITQWQKNLIIITDLNAQKIYSWDTTTLTTVFTAQPANWVAVYAGRLWMGNGLTVTFTAGGTYNSLGGDAGSFIITDSSAATALLAIVAFQGSLYFFGSSWIASLNGVQSTGSPAVVSFVFTVLEGTVGIVNRWSIVVVGVVMYFANVYGFWQFTGAVPEKISSQIDGFFQNITLASSSFSGAFAEVFGEPLVMWTAFYNDPQGITVGQTTFCYTSNNQWFRMFGNSVSFVTSLPATPFGIGNPQPTAYAANGTGLYKLFSGPAGSTTVGIFNTKILDQGSKARFKLYDYLFIFVVIGTTTTVQVQLIGYNGLALGNPVSKTVNPAAGQWVNASGQVGQWVNNALTAGNWQGTAAFVYQPYEFNCGFESRGMGLNVTVTGEQVAIQAISVGYRKSKRGARGTPQAA